MGEIGMHMHPKVCGCSQVMYVCVCMYAGVCMYVCMHRVGMHVKSMKMRFANTVIAITSLFSQMMILITHSFAIGNQLPIPLPIPLQDIIH